MDIFSLKASYFTITCDVDSPSSPVVTGDSDIASLAVPADVWMEREINLSSYPVACTIWSFTHHTSGPFDEEVDGGREGGMEGGGKGRGAGGGRGWTEDGGDGRARGGVWCTSRAGVESSTWVDWTTSAAWMLLWYATSAW